MYSARTADWVFRNLLVKWTLSELNVSAVFFHLRIFDFSVFLDWVTFFDQALKVRDETDADNDSDALACDRTDADEEIRSCENVRDNDCSDLIFFVRDVNWEVRLIILHFFIIFRENIILI